jgi:putative addiction module antidote
MAKVTKIGNSLGVTIPREELEALGLKQGDEVIIRRRGSHLEIVPVELRPKLRPALQRAVDRTVEKFGPALDELAK